MIKSSLKSFVRTSDILDKLYSVILPCNVSDVLFIFYCVLFMYKLLQIEISYIRCHHISILFDSKSVPSQFSGHLSNLRTIKTVQHLLYT